jgi:hypothetical protein
MRGFTLEMEKAAGFATLKNIGQRALEFGKKNLAGRYGRQLALGAGLGAVGGAVTGDDENWKKRALQGALLGGAAAGGRILSTKAGRTAATEGAKRFGEKQLYTLTGKGFKGRELSLDDARKLGIVEAMPKSPQLAAIGPRSKGELKQLKNYAKKAKQVAEQEHAFEQGFQSIPGVVHGALTRPGQLIRSGWERAGTGGKIFAGLGAAEAARGALKKPEEGGPGRAQAALGSLGSSLGYLVAPGAMLGQSVIGTLGSKAGETVGKAGDTAADIARARKAARTPSPQQLRYAYQRTGMPLYDGR